MLQKQSQTPSNNSYINGALQLQRPGYLPAALLFAFGTLVLAFPWLSGKYTIPWDAKAEFYPSLVFLARSIHSGDWPFWAPIVFGGQFQLADPQSLIFSPPFLILALINSAPSFQAADAAVFVTLFCGGLCILMYGRDRGWHPAGSLVAAFVFSFGASNAWRIQHVGQVMSLCWFAAALWLLARAIDRRSLLWGLLAGIACAFMVIGRDQVALLCALILAGYVLTRLFERPFGLRPFFAKIPALLAAGLTGAAIAAIPVLLTAIFASESNRPLITYEGAVAASLHPAAFFTVISADIFGTAGPMAKYWGPPTPEVWNDSLALARNMADIYFGAIPVVVILAIGIVRGRIFDRQIRFFTFVAILATLYALGKYTPFFQLFYKLPGADMFRRPADATFHLGAMLALISGYLVHRLLDAEDRLTLKQFFSGAALVVLALLSCVFIAWYKGRLAQSGLPLLIATVSFFGGSFMLWMMRLTWHRTLIPVFLAAIAMTADLRLSNGPNESTALPPKEYDVLRQDTANPTITMLMDRLQKASAPDRRDRVELSAIGFAWPDAPLVHGFDQWLGYNPLILGWYANATGAIDHVAIPEQRKFSPLFESYRSPMLNLLGVRFVATGVPIGELDKTYKAGDLAEVARTKDAYIYENPRALPRVLIASRAIEADFDSMIKTGVWPQADFRDTVLLGKGETVTLSTQGDPSQKARARILHYGNTVVRVEATASEPGWLVLHDTWHPWWTVEIDGKPAKLLRANVIFRAVAIPAGRHEVTFRFKPFEGLRAFVEAKLK